MKFDVDYEKLETSIASDPVYKYADVRHRLVSLGFGIVRFMDSENIDGLWQIQETDDGEVIIATYDDSGLLSVEKTASASNWLAEPNNNDEISLFYRNNPVTKISLAKLGIKEPANEVCNTLTSSLDNNPKLLKGLLACMSNEERSELFSLAPELVDLVK